MKAHVLVVYRKHDAGHGDIVHGVGAYATRDEALAAGQQGIQFFLGGRFHVVEVPLGGTVISTGRH